MFGFSSPFFIVIELPAVYILYFVLKCIYRLTLHPLARFPGPKKAAMSRLYGMTWDLPIKTSYVKEFTRWHDDYKSPIVRIEPNHLHIKDLDAYNEIFKMGTKFTKDPVLYSFPYTKGSMFNKLGGKEATSHRSLYTHAFSKTNVQSLEPVVRLHLSQFLQQIDDAAQKDKSIDLTLGFRCLTADTVMRYAYNKPYGATLAPDFQDKMIIDISAFFQNATPSWYGGHFFVQLIAIIEKLPRHWVTEKGISAALSILDGCNARINELSKEPKDERKPNIFRTALSPNAAKGQLQLSNSDMGADALLKFIAGTDTTANALTFGTYHLLRKPDLLKKIQNQLDAAIPKSSTLSSEMEDTYPLTFRELEQLPLYHGMIKESLRLSYGVPGKLPRVVPEPGVTLAGKFIPGGTVVSASAYAYHTNPHYFDDPLEFKPERWIKEDGQFAANGGVDPEKAFIPFSRGTRACLGSNLADAELHYSFAHLLRNFDLSLFETTDHDMDWHDTFVPSTYGHLRVKAKRRTV